MQYNLRRRYLHSISKGLLINIFLVLLTAIPAFSQGMSYSTTVYTDFSVSDGSPTIHAWGYTYAPSGTSIIHNYQAKTKITLPGGSYVENSATGSGYNPAIANVYINVTQTTPEGVVDLFTTHKAFCPQVYMGATPFLSAFTGGIGSWPRLGIATTTFQHNSSIPGPNSTVVCFSTSNCLNTATPKCGAYGGRHVRAAEEGCCSYYQSGYVTVNYSGGGYNCFNVGFHLCISGPGICTVP